MVKIRTIKDLRNHQIKERKKKEEREKEITRCVKQRQLGRGS